MSVKKLSDVDDGQHGVHVAKVGVDKFLTDGMIYHSKTILGFSVHQGCLVHVGRGGSRNEVMLCAWYTTFITDVQNMAMAVIVAWIKTTSALRRAYLNENELTTEKQLGSRDNWPPR